MMAGRFGKKGWALNLVTTHEEGDIKFVEQYFDRPSFITKLPEDPTELEQVFNA